MTVRFSPNVSMFDITATSDINDVSEDDIAEEVMRVCESFGDVDKDCDGYEATIYASTLWKATANLERSKK